MLVVYLLKLDCNDDNCLVQRVFIDLVIAKEALLHCCFTDNGYERYYLQPMEVSKDAFAFNKDINLDMFSFIQENYAYYPKISNELCKKIRDEYPKTETLTKINILLYDCTKKIFEVKDEIVLLYKKYNYYLSNNNVELKILQDKKNEYVKTLTEEIKKLTQ